MRRVHSDTCEGGIGAPRFYPGKGDTRVANWPWLAIPISIRVQYQNQARADGPPETTMAAIVLITLAYGYLSLLSTTFIRVV